MGITAKIWTADEDALQQCAADPHQIDKIFHTCDPKHALIHDARPLHACLSHLSFHNTGLRSIAGASDPSFTMSAACVRAMLDPRRSDPHQEILTFKTMATNRTEISDVAQEAVRRQHGLIFVIFED